MLKPREALLLAGGLSTRFGEPKYAAKAGGVPLIAYPISALISVGVARIVAVAATGYAELVKELLEPARMFGVEVVVYDNPWPERGNGLSFIIAASHARSEWFYVTMCDHVYTVGMLEALATGIGELRIAGDREARFIDLEEATKVKCSDHGAYEESGKNLEHWSFVDTGVFLASRRAYEAVKHLAPGTDDLGFSTRLLREARSRGVDVRVVDVTGMPWCEVDTRRDLEELVAGPKRAVLEAAWRERGDALQAWKAY